VEVEITGGGFKCGRRGGGAWDIPNWMVKDGKGKQKVAKRNNKLEKMPHILSHYWREGCLAVESLCKKESPDTVKFFSQGVKK